MTDTAYALASVDLETTGLDPIRHAIWEAAVIRREPGAAPGTETRRLWQISPTEFHLKFIAEPKGLEVGRFAERMVVPGDIDALDMTPTLTGGAPVPVDHREVARALCEVLTGTVMIGSNAHFDASFLHRFLSLDRDPWHYRPVCVATMAAGYRYGQAASGAYAGDFAFAGDYPGLPFSSRTLSRQLGAEPPGPDLAHTALADAQWALDVYDAITKGAPAWPAA